MARLVTFPKTIAIIQARMGSTRLPGKVMRQVLGVPLIQTLIQRLQLAKSIDLIVLATSTEPVNDPLELFVSGFGIPVYRGSETDVLDRYYQAAKKIPSPNGNSNYRRLPPDRPGFD